MCFCSGTSNKRLRKLGQKKLNIVEEMKSPFADERNLLETWPQGRHLHDIRNRNPMNDVR